MFVKYVTEKPDGTVAFQGHIEGAELKWLIELGLQTMLDRGMSIPFQVDDGQDSGEPFDYSRIIPNNGTEQ